MAITEHYVASDGTDTWGNSTSSSTPCSLATALSNAAAGDRVNIKVGTYTRTGTTTFATNGTTTSPIIFRGVDGSWAPIPITRTGNYGAISSTLPRIAIDATFYWAVSGSYVWLECLKFTGSRNGAEGVVQFLTGTDRTMYGCIVENSNTAAGGTCNASAHASGDNYINSDLSVTSSTGYAASYCIYSSSNNARVFFCRLTSAGTSIGIRAGAGGTIVGNVIYGMGGHAISAASSSTGLYVIDNTLVGVGGSGISIATGYSALVITANNRITDCGAYGIIAVDATTKHLTFNNRLDRNTSGAYSGSADWITASSWALNTTSALAADEYVNAATRDYSLVAGAPGMNTGIPYARDIGAFQTPGTGTTVEVGGGGGGGGSSGYVGVAKKGTTSKIYHVSVSSSVDGTPKTGLANTAISCYYMRTGASAAVSCAVNSITTLGTFAGSATAAAWREVSAANMPGEYEVHLPNNALLTGAGDVTFLFKDAGANDFTPVRIQVQLVDYDPSDTVRLGLTALPNAAAGATSGLPIGTDLATASSLKDSILGSAIPGTYTAGTLGYNVGTYLQSAVATAANVWAYATKEITGVSTAAGNAIADAILDRADSVETGLTVRQLYRSLGAGAMGKVAGANGNPTCTVTIRAAISDSKVRHTSASDEFGNRTVTSDLT
jgi:hypothetical protein